MIFKKVFSFIYIFINLYPYGLNQDIGNDGQRVSPNGEINKQIDVQNDEPTIISKRVINIITPDGNPVQITKIRVHRGFKNLNPNKDRPNPFNLIVGMDNFLNLFFEDIIRDMKRLQDDNTVNNIPNNDDNNNENENNNNDKNLNNNINSNTDKSKEEKEMDFSLDEENNNKKDKNNDSTLKNNQKDNISDLNKVTNKTNTNNVNNITKHKKYKKELSKKDIIFSRICKYIFYSIVIFTVYILGRKFFQILDIIDSDKTLTEINLEKISKQNEEEKTDTVHVKNKVEKLK